MNPSINREEDVVAVLHALRKDAKVIEQALAIRAVRWASPVFVLVSALAATLLLCAAVRPLAEVTPAFFWVGAGVFVAALVFACACESRESAEPDEIGDAPLSPLALAWIKRRASTHATGAIHAMASTDGRPPSTRHAREHLALLEQAIRRRNGTNF